MKLARISVNNPVTVNTVMITVMSCALVVIKKGIHASWGYILIASLCVSLAYTMMGFILASPFEGFSNFIVAFALFFAVMEIPALSYFSPILLVI